MTFINRLSPLCFQAPLPRNQPPRKGRKSAPRFQHKPPRKLGWFARFLCLFLLSLCGLIQTVTTFLLRKKRLSAKRRKQLLAYHATLNEAAIRILRR